MYSKNKVVLTNFALIALLSLISCTAKASTAEPPLILPSTLSPSTTPKTIFSTAAYTATPTSIPSSILLLPTESLFQIPNGRVLFVRDSIKNDINSNGLVLLDLKTNESILVVHKDEELNGQTVSLSYPNITWSPDGPWIAFVGTNFGADIRLYAQEDIYIVKSDGTQLRRLTNSPRYNKWDIAWSPDGQYLLVAMGINGSDLYLIHARSGEIIERLTSSGRNYVAAWSPDGKRVAYAEYSGLSVMNIAVGTSQRISLPVSDPVQSISWSPNNQQIALVLPINNSNCNDIFIININSLGTINLTSSDYFEASPGWSSDGKHLVFLRSMFDCNEMDGQRDSDIYITNLLGEEHKIVSSAGSGTTVAWAPVPALEMGNQYSVTQLGANLNLRAEPSLSGKIIEKLPAGEVITVLEGFVDADDYYWWKIQTQNGTEGWAIEVANWYQPVNP